MKREFILKTAVSLTATLFVGKFPKIPGTLGSALAVVLWWLLSPQGLVQQMSFIGGAILIAWISIHLYERQTQSHDPKEVVIDELVGMWITLVGVPSQIFVFICGFFLFRLFDIWKPFPINWVDRNVPGAFGTLFDDVLAGLLAFGVLNLFLIFWIAGVQ